MEYVCQSCGFKDTKELRDGVNNHFRPNYIVPLHPKSEDAICYSPTTLQGRNHGLELD